MRRLYVVRLLVCLWLGGGLVPVWAQDRQARKALGNYDFSQHGLQAVRLRYPALTGAGLVVSVKEQPFDTADIDFRGRLVITPLAKSFSDHASTMATLLAGAGNTAPSSRGVARGVRLVSASYDRLAPDTLPELRRLGVSIQNHSYGVAIERFYGRDARAYDDQVAQQPTLLHVFSSGNSGAETPTGGPLPGPFMTLTGEFKQAKNTLVVGGISSRGVLEARSSRGPTIDGRIKPELVAYGDNGTSESAALVSGVAALLQQTYRDQQGQLPSSAWVKACLIAGCEDIGLPGPDHEAGFGNFDALGAVTVAANKQYQTGSVGSGATQSFTLVVPPNIARLTVALAWHDTPAATPTLRQNLDLLLDPPAGAAPIRPWVLSAALHPDSVRLPARRGTDRVNNVEQVSVQQPVPGVYRVRVVGMALPDGPQPYAVAYAIDSVLTWASPTAGAVLTTGEAQPIRWRWRGDKTVRGTLSAQTVGDTTWQPVAEDIALADQLVWWTTPNRSQRARVRLVTGVGTFVSDTFALVQSTSLRVLLNCPERAAVSWARQPGVTAWQLYKLGPLYLEPIRQITDTVAFLTPKDGLYVAVSPILAGKPTQPGFTINYQRQGVGCYVAGWLARQTVTDTVRLDLDLGTTWNLRPLVLERATGLSDFTPLQTITPTATQTTYTFTDQPPGSGATRYRVRLTTQTGETILTDEETVFNIQPSEQVVFPNPVELGQPVSVVIQAPEATGIWISPSGQRIRMAPLSGVIKQIPTTRLTIGVYLLQITDSSGKQHVTRVVVR
ncbi:S8 family peptidase [Fibrella aquatilis]|uniref:S8 family peptidase n=1 Tax=Fibrella aquatilis TaxID=2817059 RepID=A0A939JYS1_9BACT|nr:S8 family peptidase [Fibrella aquatilis]MBO0930161.1 S8 family peptidase [Fibrella aquatilis]